MHIGIISSSAFWILTLAVIVLFPILIEAGTSKLTSPESLQLRNSSEEDILLLKHPLMSQHSQLHTTRQAPNEKLIRKSRQSNNPIYNSRRSSSSTVQFQRLCRSADERKSGQSTGMLGASCTTQSPSGKRTAIIFNEYE
jgi:hypothetical protein